MNNKCRLARDIGVLIVSEIDWHFRVYLMQGDPEESIDTEALFGLLEQKVRMIAAEHLSDEFNYIKSGFILAHYGRRGVTFSFWHWADWDGTWEFFCQAWYCYGRALADMTFLDRSEPVLCQHEIPVITEEGAEFRNLALPSTELGTLIHQYRNRPRLSHC